MPKTQKAIFWALGVKNSCMAIIEGTRLSMVIQLNQQLVPYSPTNYHFKFKIDTLNMQRTET
jgi:hypothetical protein